MKTFDNYKKYLPVVWFFAVAALYIFLYVTRINYLLDSDMSSEMVLSDILTKEHGIISKNWFYSTELRFLNNQLIFEFFLLFGHNYHISRVLSGIVLMAIMLYGYYYMLKHMGLRNYYFATAPVLMLPFSVIYSDIILVGLYYIPHISISFFSLGLIFAIENEANIKKKRFLLIALLILSLVAGIGGPRQIIIFYLPLALTGLLRFYVSRKLTFKSIYYAFIASAVGYVINSKILIKSYKYNGWAGFKYVGFSSEKLDMILQGFLNVLGFTDGEVFSFATVRTGVSFLLIFLAFLYYIYYFKNKSSLEDKEIITGSFVLTATLIYFAIYLFTDMFYEDRYTLPFIVFLLPLIGFTLKNHGWIRPCKVIFITIFSLAILASSVLVYKASWLSDKTSEHRQIVNFLTENDYNNGYSTYWNANLLTELSNGRIDSYVWTSSIENISDIDDLYRWLQVKSHKEIKPSDKVFIVLSATEYNNSVLKRYLGPDSLVFNTDNYYVFGFDDYESLVAHLSSYTFDLEDTGYLGSCIIDSGKWLVETNCSNLGPFITLYEGKYLITVKGSNLTNANIHLGYSLDENEGINILDPESVALYGEDEAILDSLDPVANDATNNEATNSDEPGLIIMKNEDTSVIYVLTVNKNLHDFQLIVSNDSDSSVYIEEMSILRY